MPCLSRQLVGEIFSRANENWIKWDIFKIYIYVTVILTFKKGLILMKKADK